MTKGFVLTSPWVFPTQTRSRVPNLNDVSAADAHVQPVRIRRRTLPVTRFAAALALQELEGGVEVPQPRGFRRIVLVL